MSNFQPAGTKDVKINLAGAYRTTFTHLVEGDVIRLDRRVDGLANGALIPTPTHSPKRSFWATVTKVERAGRIQITTDQGLMPWEAAHTSITRKERKSETTARLAIDATARQAALLDSEREVAAGHIQDMAAEHEDAARTPREALTAELAQVREDRARIVYGVTRPNVKKAAADARIAELEIQLATLDATPERAALGEPMCLGDFGAYGQCIAVPGHFGPCMDAFGHRFDGRNRNAALPTRTITLDQLGDPDAMFPATSAYPVMTGTPKTDPAYVPVIRQDEIRPISGQTEMTKRTRGVQVWHPDYTGTVWVVTAAVGDQCNLVVPATGDVLLDVPAWLLQPVTVENMAAYVATLGPRGGGAALALVAVQDRLRKGTQASDKVKDARRVLADKLAGAKEQRRAMNGRFLDLDRVAQAANDARIEALEEALSLLA